MTQAALGADERVRLQTENTELNHREFTQGKSVLESVPQRVFLQINAVCNADCVFCSKGYDYPTFGFDDYMKGLGPKLDPVLMRSREVILTGSGEFLGLPQADRILAHFNERFPHVDKFIATNASHRPKIWELIAASQSRYTLQISIHAADRAGHKRMMRFDKYDEVMENLRFLAGKRRETGNLKLHLMYIMTTLNAEGLPDFIRWGAELGVDRITAGYFYIYESQQKYLSLFFKKDLANRVIDEARRAAGELGVEVSLPEKFGQVGRPGAAMTSCSEPWHQTMVNTDGRVLPCDVFGEFNESLNEKSFMELWNGESYRKVRENLSKGTGCIESCPRKNAAALDRWETHVIRRHKDEKLIVREYHEAMRKP